MKYLYVEAFKNDEIIKEFETEEEATKHGDYMLAHTSEADKKQITEMYILESANPDPEADNHFDGDIIKRYI